jgi:predicted nucleic acid-binding protein
VADLEGSLVTCEAVIAESCYLLRDVRGAAEAVLANVLEGVFELPFRLDRSARSVKALMRKYADVPMDLADACLVQMADELGTGDILTLDPDFATYRWRRNRRFASVLAL